MEERPLPEQTEHDLVIQAAAGQFGASVRYDIHVNLGEERSVKVGGEYPDIVVTVKGMGDVKFIIEVETCASMERSEVPHWRTLSRLGPAFYLLVPYRVMPIAQQLCRDGGVRCHFGYYIQDEHGRFKVVLRKD